MSRSSAWPVALSIGLVPFAGWATVRVLGLENGFPGMPLMAFTPYVAAAAVVPALAAAATRQWRHAAVGAVLAGVLAGCVLPRALPDPDAARPGGVRLRVLTANLFVGAADPRALVELVRSRRVDLLAVQELTPPAVDALRAAGLDRVLPYSAEYPNRGARGSGLYSRFPLTATGVRLLPSPSTQAQATLTLPGASPVLIESAHPFAPSDGRTARQWATDLAAEPACGPPGDVRLLLGDFNSSLDHAGLRHLVGTGYRDAADVVGAGLRPTWPFLGGNATGHDVAGHLLPPVALDHVLADHRIGVLDVAVHPIRGSDHRAVYADLELPSSGDR